MKTHSYSGQIKDPQVLMVHIDNNEPSQEDMSRLLKPFDIDIHRPIFIKPNLAIAGNPESGIVTDIRLIRALVEFLRKKGAERISIGEGPVIGHEAMDVFDESGFTDLAIKERVTLIDLNKVERTSVEWHYGDLSIPRLVPESFYINFAKLKTHVQTVVSLSLKNQKGLLLPNDKKRFHREWGLHKPIAHLAQVVTPNLVIVDGVIGLEGDGPLGNGSPRQCGVMLASKDMVAIYSACCHLVGIDPNTVPHLKHAEEIGVGTMFKEPSVFKQHSMGFQKPNQSFRKLGKLYAIRNPYACTGCGDSIAEAINHLKSTPKCWPRLVTVGAYRALLGGMVLLTGKNASTNGLKGKRICIGVCTKSLADEEEICFVSGCPPNPKEIAHAILH